MSYDEEIETVICQQCETEFPEDEIFVGEGGDTFFCSLQCFEDYQAELDRAAPRFDRFEFNY